MVYRVIRSDTRLMNRADFKTGPINRNPLEN